MKLHSSNLWLMKALPSYHCICNCERFPSKLNVISCAEKGKRWEFRKSAKRKLKKWKTLNKTCCVGMRGREHALVGGQPTLPLRTAWQTFFSLTEWQKIERPFAFSDKTFTMTWFCKNGTSLEQRMFLRRQSGTL